jgi:hypothetical protein
MDIKQLRARLEALQNPKSSQKGDLPKTLWAPTVGKHSVRIVPSMYNKTNPFTELYFHYEIGNKTMISLTNFGEKDPIVEFAQKLRKSSEREDWMLAKKLEPKMRVFAPVIVRGQEDKGVMLWGFGKQIFMDLLSIAEDEDVGDYTDALSGRDITIETLGKETTGLTYNKSTIRVRTKVTPLSENADEIKKWLQNQPDPKAQFKKYGYDELKAALLGYLNPESEEETTTTTVAPQKPAEEQTTGDLPWEKKPEGESNKKYSLNTSKPDVDSKIDELFDF